MYLGLLGEDGREIQAREYHRVCLDDMTWGMTHDFKAGCVVFSFFNLRTIKFPKAKSRWGFVRPAFFLDESGDQPHLLLDQPFPACISVRVTGGYAPGKLRIDSP